MGASQSLGFDDPDMLEKETPIAISEQLVNRLTGEEDKEVELCYDEETRRATYERGRNDMREEIRAKMENISSDVDDELEFFGALAADNKTYKEKMKKESQELNKSIQMEMKKQKHNEQRITQSSLNCENVLQNILNCYNEHGDNIMECQSIAESYKLCTTSF